jgi:uncharacterized protein (DUF58 family)
LVTRRLAGLVHGDYRGLFPGPGSEAGDGRPYVIGDDVRLMDWNLTARTSHPHVREPIWDHELDLWILADLSASMAFGTATGEKRHLVLLAAAAFGFPARRLANRIGAVVVQGNQTVIIPSRTTAGHFLGLLQRLAETPSVERSGRTELASSLRRLDGLAQRRRLVAVISDFLVADGWQLPLGRLATRHSVVAVQVVDPRELELPDVGYLQVQDPETGAVRTVPTSDRRFRANYAAAAVRQQAAIAAAITKAGAEHLCLRTDLDWLGQVVRFFQLRRRRQQGYRARWLS